MTPEIKLAIVSGLFLLAATALGAGITLLTEALRRRHEEIRKYARIALEDVAAYHAIEAELVKRLHEENADLTELAIKRKVRADLRTRGIETPSRYGNAEEANKLIRELGL